MRILISGSTGFIGTALVKKLQDDGHTIVRLVRDAHHAGILWDPYKKTIDRSRLEGFDVVVNLSGESINGRWTSSKKKKIIDSRVESARFLADCFRKLQQPPKAYISASAIGYYGDRNDEELTESSKPGNDFLAEVCMKWEAEAKPIADAGIRVAHIRTGLVLSPDGGAFKQLLLPFKLGLGGPVGSGRQWWSWIAFSDIIKIYEFAITNDISGPVNAVAPNAVRNREFVKLLGKALHRPAFMPLPSFAVKLIFGEMGDGLLLGSQHVIPKVLEAKGFGFEQTDLLTCLKGMVG
ncbi:MAG TPA: TIGR01777 family oxidoreductase [Candidatus Kapabacteria bacterium]|nr:TIGR01777 family oxidoreductase [Candidatus Kapabacteria bacterium]